MNRFDAKKNRARPVGTHLLVCLAWLAFTVVPVISEEAPLLLEESMPFGEAPRSSECLSTNASEAITTTAPAENPPAAKDVADPDPAPDEDKEPVFDVEEVQREQTKELAAQADSAVALIQPGDGFSRKLDIYHDKLYRFMDNAVRRVDAFWVREDMAYEPELSTFHLALMTRVGGRGDDKDVDVKAKFKADLALPGLEQRIHLIFDNTGRDDLPGSDPMKREDDDIRLGLQGVWDVLRHSEIGVGGGVRWRSSGPVAYGDIDWRYEHQLAHGRLRLTPRIFYYSDDGFGQSATLEWRRPMLANTNIILQLVSSEKSTEDTDGFELESTVRLAWLRSGHHRGWLFQASIFPEEDSGDWTVDNGFINVSWRDALYRKWIYYTVTPQVDFAHEDDHEPRFSIRISFDILFGGRISRIL